MVPCAVARLRSGGRKHLARGIPALEGGWREGHTDVEQVVRVCQEVNPGIRYLRARFSALTPRCEAAMAQS